MWIGVWTVQGCVPCGLTNCRMTVEASCWMVLRESQAEMTARGWRLSLRYEQFYARHLDHRLVSPCPAWSWGSSQLYRTGSSQVDLGLLEVDHGLRGWLLWNAVLDHHMSWRHWLTSTIGWLSFLVAILSDASRSLHYFGLSTFSQSKDFSALTFDLRVVSFLSKASTVCLCTCWMLKKMMKQFFRLWKSLMRMSIDTFGSVGVVHGDSEANEACEAANWAALRVSVMWRNL